MKAYENKIVFETSLINQAVANAIYNVNRKKGRKFLPLWKKKPKRAETELMKETAQKIAREEDKSWVAKIYKANNKLKDIKQLNKKRGT